jgi:hypothetical protein
MREDRPLTEFTDTEEDSRDHESDGGGDDPTTAEVDPATATYRWQPDGAVCARCGATTERQWRDDDEFVCPDCKAW